MSKRSSIAFTTLAFLILGVFILSKNHSSIDLSSYSQQKALVLKKIEHKHERGQLHQKVLPPIKIEIQHLGEAIKAGNQFEIRAIVSSSVATENVQIKWSIPEYLKPISGDLEPVISYLPANENVEVSFVLESFSEDNQQIHVIAHAPYGDNVWSATDQYNTTLEEIILEKKKGLAKRHQEYLHKMTR